MILFPRVDSNRALTVCPSFLKSMTKGLVYSSRPSPTTLTATLPNFHHQFFLLFSHSSRTPDCTAQYICTIPYRSNEAVLTSLVDCYLNYLEWPGYPSSSTLPPRYHTFFPYLIILIDIRLHLNIPKPPIHTLFCFSCFSTTFHTMAGGRRYRDEQIQYVLDNCRTMTTSQIVQNYREIFDNLTFGKEQVKYIKTNYGHNPEFG